MPDWIMLIFFVGIIGFLMKYNGFLKRNYGCTAVNSGRILIALIDLVLWIGIYDADGFSFILILAVLAAIALFLLLIALNHQTVENGLHAVLMSLWQMLAVLAVVMIWYEMTRDKKGK